MILILCILIPLLLSAIASRPIKRLMPLLMILFGALALFATYWQTSEWRHEVPEALYPLVNLFEKLWLKGILGTGLYLAVMLAGAFHPRHRLGQRLRALRSEWSVLGGFAILPHILTRAVQFWPPTRLSTIELLLYLDGVALLVMLMPLWLTSFPAIRRRIPAERWRRGQKTAYLFYALIALHGILLHAGLTGVHHALYFYIGLFAFYLIKRLSLAYSMHRTKAAKA